MDPGGVGEGGLIHGGIMYLIHTQHWEDCLKAILVNITSQEQWKILYNLIVLDPPFRFGMDMDSCHLATKILSDKQNGT